MSENPPNRLQETVPLHNDYFSTHFLLAFPVAGVHTVSISTYVIDAEAIEWSTGVTSQIQVRAPLETGETNGGCLPW